MQLLVPGRSGAKCAGFCAACLWKMLFSWDYWGGFESCIAHLPVSSAST